MSLDFDNMDVTDHGHVPYLVILVRVLEEWKKQVSRASGLETAYAICQFM